MSEEQFFKREGLYKFPGDGYFAGVFCKKHVISEADGCWWCAEHHVLPIPFTEVNK